MNIIVNINGRPRAVDASEYGANTVGDLFANPSFTADFAVPNRAIPQMNGAVVDTNTQLTEQAQISYTIGASSKSA